MRSVLICPSIEHMFINKPCYIVLKWLATFVGASVGASVGDTISLFGPYRKANIAVTAAAVPAIISCAVHT